MSARTGRAAGWRIASGLCIATIVAVSAIPVGPPLVRDWLSEGFDKLAHAALYLGLGLLLAVTCRRSGAPVRKGLLLAAGVGIGTELLQAALPWRTFELLDIAANLSGAAVGALAVVRLPVVGRRAADRVGPGD